MLDEQIVAQAEKRGLEERVEQLLTREKRDKEAFRREEQLLAAAVYEVSVCRYPGASLTHICNRLAYV